MLSEDGAEVGGVFVQVIRGAVGSEPQVLELLDRWRAELAAGAEGWLGSTAGVTPGGELVLVARFASVEDAARNSDRPEQTAWWEELETCFTGPVTFHDCREVALIRGGGDDAAGFVQVMVWPSGSSVDASALADAGTAFVERHRPDVLGGVVAVADDGAVLQVVYFSSEEDAREAEARPASDEEPSDELRVMERLGEPSYLDLPHPRIVS
jgi:hypothetical protein